ncbi:MAG: ABC transporter ATP-binding protein [Clostridiales Family XIII bacterium]|nr:ABC transporter ATP-binding protein [Clostridiales Family XIII bacterium]
MGYGGAPVVKNVSLSIPEGNVSIFIGANACGKSTLLKAMARLLKPMSGEITLGGKRIDSIPTKKLAQNLGLLPQSPIVPDGITVSDLVGRGRFPHKKFFRGWTEADTNAVSDAMDAMNISDIADRCIDELSGGQRQRVWIAMALAQQTDILLLDEPTTYLDIAHQVEILDMLLRLNQKRGITIVMVLHEVNLAARYADHLFAMRLGEIVASGFPREIITADLTRDVFALDSLVVADPVSGAPMICPKGKCGR